MEISEFRRVGFSCHAPEAQSVFVTGRFNGWRADGIPLRRETGGNWKITLQLPPGHHEFKFVVDGQWCCELGCEQEYHGCPKCDEFGTMNRY